MKQSEFFISSRARETSIERPQKKKQKSKNAPQFKPPALSQRSSLLFEKATRGAKNAAWRSRCPGAGRRDAGTDRKPDKSCCCCFVFSTTSWPSSSLVSFFPSSFAFRTKASSTSCVHCQAATPTLATTRLAPSKGPPAAS